MNTSLVDIVRAHVEYIVSDTDRSWSDRAKRCLFIVAHYAHQATLADDVPTMFFLASDDCAGLVARVFQAPNDIVVPLETADPAMESIPHSVVRHDVRTLSDDEVIEQYGALVSHVLNRLKHKGMRTIGNDDDLHQEGLLGLVAAKASYDPSKGTQFKTYAQLRIRGAILDGARAADPIGRTYRKRIKKLDAVETQLAGEGSIGTDEEVSKQVGVTPHELVELCRLRKRIAILQFDYSSSVDNRRDSIEDTRATSPEQQVILRDYIEKTLSRGILTPAEARIMREYYLEDRTMIEVSHIVGLSESRVCQLHRRALETLQIYCAPDRTILEKQNHSI